MPDARTPAMTDQTTPTAKVTVGAPAGGVATDTGESVFDVEHLSFHYGQNRALTDVSMTIRRREITALIGPSGCGKTTFLRCLNRLNDLIPGTRVEGRLDFDGQPLYGPGVRAIEVRRRIGMVFQKPNPFPKSIYDNIAYGLRILGMK